MSNIHKPAVQKDIQMVTLANIPGAHISKTLGIVRAHGRGFSSADALEDALERLHAAARAKAADAVLSIQLSQTSEATAWGTHTTDITLLGTAVTLAEPTERDITS